MSVNFRAGILWVDLKNIRRNYSKYFSLVEKSDDPEGRETSEGADLDAFAEEDLL